MEGNNNILKFESLLSCIGLLETLREVELNQFIIYS
jgi:hypothetical protein